MADSHQITPQAQLSGEGLLLRPYRHEDAAALYVAAHESAASVGRWLPWCHAGYTQADSAAWIEHCIQSWDRGDQYSFAIFDDAEHTFLGAVGLSQRNREHNFAGIGYWTRELARGHGVAARAGRLIADFGFNQVQLSRIEIVAATDNLASRRTAENIGAVFEGIARNRLIMPLSNRVVDAAVYAVVPKCTDSS